MGQVAGNVGKCQVFGANELHRWTLEHGVVFFADKPGVLNGFVYNVVHVLQNVRRVCDPFNMVLTDRVQMMPT